MAIGTICCGWFVASVSRRCRYSCSSDGRTKQDCIRRSRFAISCLKCNEIGGAAVAAAMNGMAGKKGKVVCIISGGGIDSSKLIQILQGQVPH